MKIDLAEKQQFAKRVCEEAGEHECTLEVNGVPVTFEFPSLRNIPRWRKPLCSDPDLSLLCKDGEPVEPRS